jgi:hypothetical protein
MNVPAALVRDAGEADVFLTSKSYYRKRPHAVSDAERAGIPVYVLRSNTTTQMEHCLGDIFGIRAVNDPFSTAVEETRQAIDQILSGQRSSVDLLPQASQVRRQQHEMARTAHLLSYSKGREPYRRVRIHTAE